MKIRKKNLYKNINFSQSYSEYNIIFTVFSSIKNRSSPKCGKKYIDCFSCNANEINFTNFTNFSRKCTLLSEKDLFLISLIYLINCTKILTDVDALRSHTFGICGLVTTRPFLNMGFDRKMGYAIAMPPCRSFFILRFNASAIFL